MTQDKKQRDLIYDVIMTVIKSKNLDPEIVIPHLRWSRSNSPGHSVFLSSDDIRQHTSEIKQEILKKLNELIGKKGERYANKILSERLRFDSRLNGGVAPKKGDRYRRFANDSELIKIERMTATMKELVDPQNHSAIISVEEVASDLALRRKVGLIALKSHDQGLFDLSKASDSLLLMLRIDRDEIDLKRAKSAA